MRYESNESVDLLAKLLAKENITIMHKPVSTACFYPENRILILPNWKLPYVAKVMLVFHEVGHALHTPSKGWNDAIYRLAWSLKNKDNMTPTLESKMIAKDFLNVVEDPRIEKLQKRDYPGARSDFTKGYQILADMDFFGNKQKVLEKMKAGRLGLIDRLNLHFKVPLQYMPTFSKEEMPWVERIEKLETFEEAVETAHDLLHWEIKRKAMAAEEKKGPEIKVIIPEQKKEEPKEKKPRIRGAAGYISSKQKDDDANDEVEVASSGEISENGLIESGKTKAPETNDEEQEAEVIAKSEDTVFHQSNPFEADEELEKLEKEKLGEKVVDLSDLVEKTDDPLDGLISETQEAFAEKTDDAAKESMQEEVVYSNLHIEIPEFHYEKFVDDFPVVLEQARKTCLTGVQYLEPVKKVISNETKAIAHLIKEFEIRKAADRERRTLTARTGKLDPNRLHHYKYSDDLFKKMKIEPGDETNHGFILILDGSQSMTESIYATGRQLMTLSLFCRKLGVPFDVYLFRTAHDHEATQRAHDEPNTPHLSFGPFRLRNLLSSRMSQTQFTTGLRYLYAYMMQGGINGRYLSTDPMRSTPLMQTLAALPGMVERFRELHKVQIMNVIILTDGDSDGCYLSGTENNFDESETKAVADGKKVMHLPILKDKKRHKEFELRSERNLMSGYGGMAHDEIQIALLQRIRSTTNSNVIGFFLTRKWADVERRLSRYSMMEGGKQRGVNEIDVLKKDWRDEGFISCSNAGFDEYFFMKNYYDKEDEEWGKSYVDTTAGSDKLTVREQKAVMKKAVKKLSNEFIDQLSKKTVNRRLLTAFVDHISKFERKR